MPRRITVLVLGLAPLERHRCRFRARRLPHPRSVRVRAQPDHSCRHACVHHYDRPTGGRRTDVICGQGFLSSHPPEHRACEAGQRGAATNLTRSRPAAGLFISAHRERPRFSPEGTSTRPQCRRANPSYYSGAGRRMQAQLEEARAGVEAANRRPPNRSRLSNSSIRV